MAITGGSSKVYFKTGIQSKYDTLAGSRDAGTFYVTSDTHRLYLGDDLLSQSIITVDSIADLPTGDKTAEGQFYYVKSDSSAGNTHKGNILCVYTGGNWVQINPDTNTDNNKYVSSLVVSKDVVTNDDGKKDIKVTIKALRTTEELGKSASVETEAAATVVGDFVITADDIGAITTRTAVDVEASVASNVATVKTSGVGSSGDGIKITAGDNVQISKADNEDGFTISATDTTYTLGSSGGTISLAGGAAATTVELEGDGTYVAVAGDGDNKIKISHNTVAGLDATKTYGSSASTTPAAKTGVIKVPTITVDAAGHIKTIADQSITLPADTTYTMVTPTASATGGKFTVGINPSEGSAITATSADHALSYKITVDGTESTIDNQGSLGSFYSASKIDEKMHAVDAMVYKGTVSKAADLPTSDVEIGWTYKVAEKFGDYAVGDILIANGTEGTDGKISGTVTWDRIEAGNLDTTYTFGVENNVISLSASTGGAAQTVTVAATGPISAVTADKTITISHDNSGVTAGTKGESATKTVDFGGTITVPKVTVNATGHVTALTESVVTLPSKPDITLNGDASSKSVTLMDGNSAKGIVKFTQGNAITVTPTVTDAATGDTVSFDIKHNDVTRTDGTDTAATLAYGGKFTIISGVTTNDQGHVTGVKTKELTLPASDDTTYALSGTVATVAANNKSVSIVDTLTPSSGSATTSTLNVKSDSLKITANGGNGYAMDLVWEEF